MSRCRSHERRKGTSRGTVKTDVVVPVRGGPAFGIFQFLAEPLGVFLQAYLIAQPAIDVQRFVDYRVKISFVVFLEANRAFRADIATGIAPANVNHVQYYP